MNAIYTYRKNRPIAKKLNFLYKQFANQLNAKHSNQYMLLVSAVTNVEW